jgi:hypothetical protein
MGVQMRGAVGARRSFMGVRRSFNRDRQKSHLAMLDAALRDHGLRELSHRRGLAAQNRGFEAILMVEMNVP